MKKYGIIIVLLLLLNLLSSCKPKVEEENRHEEESETETVEKEEETETIEEEPEDIFRIINVDEGYLIYNPHGNYGYRYGPSIILNEDGSYDVWFSSPGNSDTEWDYITYYHSENGTSWSSGEVVLRPTPGSKDECSVCDPGVIYFNGYYYLAYTSTDDYERNGYNNSVFVARSIYPDGPFEKWNGTGWGGDPEPFIPYEGDPSYLGNGEPSFVIVGEELYVYYSHTDQAGSRTRLAKADLSENWPATVHEVCEVLKWKANDSLDVVYDNDLDMFFAFTIKYRMDSNSQLILCQSDDGESFTQADWTTTMIEEYAHNCGVSKGKDGHIYSEDDLLVGYAFGERWGIWPTKFQKIWIKHTEA